MDKCPDGSHVRNCLIKPKQGKSVLGSNGNSSPMFKREGDERITAFLDGYAIIPREEYELLVLKTEGNCTQ